MSVADSALGAAALGRVFTPIMGMNAYQQKAKEMNEAGENESVVQKTALASGIAEALFEYVSIDNLIKIKNVDGMKNAVKSTLKQKAINEINQKYSGNAEYHGTVDDSSVNYENLTTTQRDAVNFVKSFAQVTGVNVKFFESEVVNRRPNS